MRFFVELVIYSLLDYTLIRELLWFLAARETRILSSHMIQHKLYPLRTSANICWPNNIHGLIGVQSLGSPQPSETATAVKGCKDKFGLTWNMLWQQVHSISPLSSVKAKYCDNVMADDCVKYDNYSMQPTYRFREA